MLSTQLKVRRDDNESQDVPREIDEGGPHREDRKEREHRPSFFEELSHVHALDRQA